MANLIDEAMQYTPKKSKNITELDKVPTNVEVEDREFVREEDGKVVKFKVILVNGEEYRIPVTVLKALKAILEIKPALKTFRVTKTGEGLKTEYTVIPLE